MIYWFGFQVWAVNILRTEKFTQPTAHAFKTWKTHYLSNVFCGSAMKHNVWLLINVGNRILKNRLVQPVFDEVQLTRCKYLWFHLWFHHHRLPVNQLAAVGVFLSHTFTQQVIWTCQMFSSVTWSNCNGIFPKELYKSPDLYEKSTYGADLRRGIVYACNVITPEKLGNVQHDLPCIRHRILAGVLFE